MRFVDLVPKYSMCRNVVGGGLNKETATQKLKFEELLYISTKKCFHREPNLTE